jgi:hypothetical protein
MAHIAHQTPEDAKKRQKNTAVGMQITPGLSGRGQPHLPGLLSRRITKWNVFHVSWFSGVAWFEQP